MNIRLIKEIDLSDLNCISVYGIQIWLLNHTVLIGHVIYEPYLLYSMTDPTKFFGCELGAQTMFDFKNERFIVNGSHDASKLQLLLDGFIKRFVLCPECSNPETQLVSVLILKVAIWVNV